MCADDADEPVAYLLMEIIDAHAHVEQLSVHPRAARQGLGRALIETAAGRTQQHGLKALTLITYRHVPWNCPYFERLGFRIVDDAHMTEGLRQLRIREAANGLDQWARLSCSGQSADEPTVHDAPGVRAAYGFRSSPTRPRAVGSRFQYDLS